MNKSLVALLPLSLLLTQCVDPAMYGGPGYPPGPGMGGYPYNDPQQRVDQREQWRDMSREAYERGLEDGRMDAEARQSQNPYRHRDRFDRSTEAAYRDGYTQAFSQASSGLGAYGGNSGYGGGYGAQPPQPQANPAQRDPAYNQGYDYGLRDLTSGKVPDPGAHVGRYDPRYRTSFERGYYDGYNSRSSSSNQGSGSWFR